MRARGKSKAQAYKGKLISAGVISGFELSQRIVYEDNHIILFNKPVGLLSQPDSSGDPDLTSELKAMLVKRDKKPGDAWLAPVHRLDRMVGGLILLAKTSKAASRLAEEMRQRRMIKRYYAVCHGRLLKPDLWQDQLSRDQRNGRYQIVENGGRKASLSVKPLAYNQAMNLSLLSVDLETGRPHQIRLQAASRGYPLCGDRRYGNRRLDRELPGIEQVASPALFAYQLGFKHPTKDLSICLALELPDDGLFRQFSL